MFQSAFALASERYSPFLGFKICACFNPRSLSRANDDGALTSISQTEVSIRVRSRERTIFANNPDACDIAVSIRVRSRERTMYRCVMVASERKFQSAFALASERWSCKQAARRIGSFQSAFALASERCVAANCEAPGFNCFNPRSLSRANDGTASIINDHDSSFNPRSLSRANDQTIGFWMYGDG